MMMPKLTLVVALFVHPGRKAEFDEFEGRAADIMRRHGGCIERRIAIAAADPTEPDEVHVVTFPDQNALDRYQQDPELVALAHVRARTIRRTIVWRGATTAQFPP
jgi:hypothetical protein